MVLNFGFGETDNKPNMSTEVDNKNLGEKSGKGDFRFLGV